MDDYQLRKQKRKQHYEKYVHGWKERPCTACNGTGFYDHDGSPECGACDGTAKELYKPTDGKVYKEIK